MVFAIMRMEKIKSVGGLKRALDHNTREKIPPNADPERTPGNVVKGGSTADGMAKFDRLKPEKTRKNAVLAVELMMTATPGWDGNWQGFLNSSTHWAIDLFGKKNVLNVAYHWDESTPHVQIVVMPLKDGKLNARHYIGGSRDRMAELQNDFWEKVGKKYRLDRGKPREETRSRHNPHTLAVKAADINQQQIAVNVAAQELDQGQRLVAAAVKAIQEIGDVTKPELGRLWPELERRIPGVVVDSVKADRLDQLTKNIQTITHNDEREKSRGRH